MIIIIIIIIIIITIPKIITTTNFTGTAMFLKKIFFLAAFLQQKKNIESKSTIRIAGKIFSSNVQMTADKLLKKSFKRHFSTQSSGAN